MVWQTIAVAINLHSRDPARSARCQPNLTSIVATLPREPGRVPEVLVPVTEYGEFNPPTAADTNLGEAIYQVRKEPVASC